MVSTGTRLRKDRESLSVTNETQFKSPKLKYFGHYSVRNQTVNLETDPKTLYHSLLKLKYTVFIRLTALGAYLIFGP